MLFHVNYFITLSCYANKDVLRHDSHFSTFSEAYETYSFEDILLKVHRKIEYFMKPTYLQV